MTGSYGIGPTRLVPAIIEATHDDAGIIWPVSVAPFEAVLINLKAGDADTDRGLRDALRRARTREGIDALYDDRDQPRRRQVRRGRPDRHPVPDHPRAARPQGGRRPRSSTARPASARRCRLAGAVGRLKSLIEPQRRDSGLTRHHRRTRRTGRAVLALRVDRWRAAICAPAARSASSRVIAVLTLHRRRRSASRTLIVVMSVMNGFRTELLTKILGLNGHFIVPADRRAALRRLRRRWRLEARSRRRRASTPSPMSRARRCASGTSEAPPACWCAASARPRWPSSTCCANGAVLGGWDQWDDSKGVAIGQRLAEKLGLTHRRPDHHHQPQRHADTRSARPPPIRRLPVNVHLQPRHARV